MFHALDCFYELLLLKARNWAKVIKAMQMACLGWAGGFLLNQKRDNIT
jgi:hypothetical protein